MGFVKAKSKASLIESWQQEGSTLCADRKSAIDNYRLHSSLDYSPSPILAPEASTIVWAFLLIIVRAAQQAHCASWDRLV